MPFKATTKNVSATVADREKTQKEKTSSSQLTFFIGTYLYRLETKKDTGT
jgi:hypothetical protein